MADVGGIPTNLPLADGHVGHSSAPANTPGAPVFSVPMPSVSAAAASPASASGGMAHTQPAPPPAHPMQTISLSPAHPMDRAVTTSWRWCLECAPIASNSSPRISPMPTAIPWTSNQCRASEICGKRAHGRVQPGSGQRPLQAPDGAAYQP